MTHKTIAIILGVIALYLTLWQSQPTINTVIQNRQIVNHQGDVVTYTYEKVAAKTCYEDVRNGQVIESHCH